MENVRARPPEPSRGQVASSSVRRPQNIPAAESLPTSGQSKFPATTSLGSTAGSPDIAPVNTGELGDTSFEQQPPPRPETPEPQPITDYQHPSNLEVHQPEPQVDVEQVQEHHRDSKVTEAISLSNDIIANDSKASHDSLRRMKESVQANIMAQVKIWWQGLDRIINQASISFHMPNVSASMKENMLKIEHFLVQPWRDEQRRGILAIHVDHENKQTILQIGTAEYGPIYITVPKVIRPEDVAVNSMRALLTRIEPFQEVVNPMAVMDGDKSYHKLNFSEIFMKSRVIRAPSGNTTRLATNLTITAKRERLSAKNTVIVNSMPATKQEYESMRLSRKNWFAWRNEAQDWNATVARTQFATTPEVFLSNRNRVK